MVFNTNARNVICLRQTGLWPAFNYIFKDQTDEKKEEKINQCTFEEFDIILEELIKTRDMIRDGLIQL